MTFKKYVCFFALKTQRLQVENKARRETHTPCHLSTSIQGRIQVWTGEMAVLLLLHSCLFCPCIPFVKIWPCLCCLVVETLQRWRMLQWRLMMERMRAWCQTRCTSKFTHFRTADHTATFDSKDHRTLSLLLLQQYTEEDNAFCHVLWISVSVCCPEGHLDRWLPVMVVVWWCCPSFPTSIFGVILILVDFVLVIVDLSLPARSREVGDAIEAVSLLISFFFLVDVLLRVYVEGWESVSLYII